MASASHLSVNVDLGPPLGKTLSVLLVDDDLQEISSKTKALMSQATSQKKEVFHVPTENEALQWAAKRKFDLILIDVKMASPVPRVKFLRKLRQSGESLNRETPIVNLSFSSSLDALQMEAIGVESVQRPSTQEAVIETTQRIASKYLAS